MNDAVVNIENCTAGTINLESIDLIRNTHEGGIGVMRVSSSCEVLLENSRLSDNIGGAVTLEGESVLRARRTIFSNNSRRDGQGGAVLMTEGTELFARSCEFIANSAGLSGGAVHFSVRYLHCFLFYRLR